MINALGIVNFPNNAVKIKGMSEYRTIAAMSFLGRYRIIDFVLSNMVNSGITNIEVLVREQPRSLVEHLGSGTQYNINPKHGGIQMLYPDHQAVSDAYYHDMFLMNENLEVFRGSKRKYVVIAQSYMICSINFADVIKAHEESGADITCVYGETKKGKTSFIGCKMPKLDKYGRIHEVNNNVGYDNKANILTETYVMKRELFLDLIEKSYEISPLFNFIDIIKHHLGTLNVRGYKYDGYLACINTLEEYYRINMEFLNPETFAQLFKEDWPIYTKTNDSPPAFYSSTGHAKNCLIANGCIIEGDLQNCILGRGVHVEKGSVIKNALLLPNTYVGPYSHIEYAIVDKHARVENQKEIIGTKDNIVYIKRRDRV